jgi:hypothetical protein
MRKVASIIFLSCAVYCAFAHIEEESSGQHDRSSYKEDTYFDCAENNEEDQGSLGTDDSLTEGTRGTRDGSIGYCQCTYDAEGGLSKVTLDIEFVK